MREKEIYGCLALVAFSTWLGALTGLFLLEGGPKAFAGLLSLVNAVVCGRCFGTWWAIR